MTNHWLDKRKKRIEEEKAKEQARISHWNAGGPFIVSTSPLIYPPLQPYYDDDKEDDEDGN